MILFYPAKQNQPEPGFSLPCLPNWANWQNAFFSLFDGVVPSTLRAVFQVFANANSANWRVRFQIWPLLQSCCDRVLLLLFLLFLLFERVAFEMLPLPFCFSGLAVILLFMFCRIWVTHSNLRGLCTEPRSGVSEQNCSIFSTPQFSGIPMKKGCIQIWTPPSFLVCLLAYLLHWFS